MLSDLSKHPEHQGAQGRAILFHYFSPRRRRSNAGSGPSWQPPGPAVVLKRRAVFTVSVSMSVNMSARFRIRTYTYLGFTFHESLVWTHHISELSCRGERRLIVCATFSLFRVGVRTAKVSNSGVFKVACASGVDVC